MKILTTKFAQITVSPLKFRVQLAHGLQAYINNYYTYEVQSH